MFAYGQILLSVGSVDVDEEAKLGKVLMAVLTAGYM